MPGQTFPNSAIKSVQQVAISGSNVTINEVDPDKTFVTNAVVVGGTSTSHNTDANFYYLLNSTTLTYGTSIATTASPIVVYVYVVEFY